MPELVNVQAVPREKVESSNISEVGHDIATDTLVVLFHHGGMYAYDDVPRQVYNDFLSADSAGKFFIANVKGKYDYRKA
ncbi:MAG: KTSC domain-containing protein [Candidatus Izemoplasmatales bacterium]